MWRWKPRFQRKIQDWIGANSAFFKALQDHSNVFPKVACSRYSFATSFWHLEESVPEADRIELKVANEENLEEV